MAKHQHMIPSVETELRPSARNRPTEDWWFGELAKFALRSRFVEVRDEEKGRIGREAKRQAESSRGT